MRILSAIVALSLCAPVAVARRKLSIAAASDLQFALADLVGQFGRAHADVDVQTAYGSSGLFYAEIGNSAPFDLFLSADSEYPRKLIAQRLAAADSFFVYGTGRLVLWVTKSSPLDLPRLEMRALEAPAVKHIAIANPRHAPYGRAAEAALRSSGVYGRVAPKLVLGENIAQAFQFVESGAAEIGVTALALAMAPTAREQGRYWEIPQDAYPKIEQAGVIPAHAKNAADAREFRAFLMSDAARRTLQSLGFH